MGKLGFRAVGVIVVVGGLMLIGFMIGVSISTNVESADRQEQFAQINDCMLLDEAVDIRACVKAGMQ